MFDRLVTLSSDAKDGVEVIMARQSTAIIKNNLFIFPLVQLVIDRFTRIRA